MNSELLKIDRKPGEKLLFLGFGNIGRQDDGLGVRLVEKLEEALGGRPDLGFESNYQLNAEDALLISEYDVVVFVDATKESGAKRPFSIRPVEPSPEIAFSTHAMSVGTVIALCEQLYQKRPRTYLLTIPGSSWEISEEMSEEASDDLALAYEAVLSWVS